MTLDFNSQPELIGKDVRLRPLAAGDFEPLYAAASDPAIWAGHPANTRHQRDVFQPYFKMLLERGGTLATIDTTCEKIIGCTRFYTAPDIPNSICIGFTFLNNAYWGGATNFNVKKLMLTHAFKTFPEIWFHIAPNNLRSQKATTKLGAEFVYDAMLDMSGGGASLTKCYRLTKETWETASATRPS